MLIIPQVYAEEEPDVDIVYIPQQLSNALNIPLIASEILISLAIMLSLALPLAMLKAKGLLILIIFFSTMGFLVVLGWLPFWLLLVLSLMVAFMYADKFKRML